MAQFYTSLSRLRNGAMLILTAAVLALSAGTTWADAAKDFTKTLDRVVAKSRPFPPKVDIYDFSDRKVNLTFGAGQPWRLINFWAAWCGPCVEELPSLKTLQDKYKNSKTFNVMLVSADMPTNGAALKYMITQKNLPAVDSYYVKDFYISQTFDMEGLPTTILVNPEGQIVYTFVGNADWQSADAMAFFKSVMPASTIP